MATRSRARAATRKPSKSSKRKATYAPRNRLDPQNYERFGEGLRSWMVDVSVKLTNIEQLVIELHKKIDPDTLLVDIGKEDVGVLEDLSPNDLSDSLSDYSSGESDVEEDEAVELPRRRERSFSRSRSPTPPPRRQVKRSSHGSHHSHHSLHPSPKRSSAVEEVKAAVEALGAGRQSQPSPPKARRSRRKKKEEKVKVKAQTRTPNPPKPKSPSPAVPVSRAVHSLPERTKPKTPSPVITKSPALAVPTFFPPTWTNRDEEERFIDSEF
jgi:hypothetical protein